MTEKIKTSEIKTVHWGSFLFSLVAAPALVTAAIQLPLYTFAFIANSDDVRGLIGLLWVLIVIGAGLYFLIGTPVLVWHLRRHPPQVGRIVMLALISLIWILPLGGLLALATFDPAALLIAMISMVFGLVGAPPLAAIFTLLYIRFLPA